MYRQMHSHTCTLGMGFKLVIIFVKIVDNQTPQLVKKLFIGLF